jgi:hypothetical protein
VHIKSAILVDTVLTFLQIPESQHLPLISFKSLPFLVTSLQPCLHQPTSPPHSRSARLVQLLERLLLATNMPLLVALQFNSLDLAESQRTSTSSFLRRRGSCARTPSSCQRPLHCRPKNPTHPLQNLSTCGN